MALVTLEEAKDYLRVSTSDEDALISSSLSAAAVQVRDVGRISNDTWEQIVSDPDEEDDNELVMTRGLCKIAVLYAMAYLFEHREQADHHDLTITLRSLLFAVREGVV